MFCRKCGKQIPSDSAFCSYCGEPVTVEDQSEQSAGKDYGFCAKCGATLPDGKLEGLCDDCLKMQEPETVTYPYGLCGRCSKPLEQDDKCGVCKNCLLDLKYEEKQANERMPMQSGSSFYTPGKIRPVEIPKQKHGCLTAVFVCVGLIVVIGIIGNMSKTTPTTANGSDTSSAKTESEITLNQHDNALRPLAHDTVSQTLVNDGADKANFGFDRSTERCAYNENYDVYFFCGKVSDSNTSLMYATGWKYANGKYTLYYYKLDDKVITNSLPTNSTPESKAPESKATTSKASSKAAISTKAKRKKATTKAKQSTAQPDENGEVNKYTYDQATDSSVQSVPKSGDPNLDYQTAAQDALKKYSNP